MTRDDIIVDNRYGKRGLPNVVFLGVEINDKKNLLVIKSPSFSDIGKLAHDPWVIWSGNWKGFYPLKPCVSLKKE